MTFNCFECCKSIHAYPCACGYQPKALGGGYWIIQRCVTEGCRSTIRVPSGSQLANPICKWCAGQEGKP